MLRLDWRVLDQSTIRRLHLEKNPIKTKSRGHLPERGSVCSLREMAARRILSNLTSSILKASKEAAKGEGKGAKSPSSQSRYEKVDAHSPSTSRQAFKAAFVAGIEEMQLDRVAKDLILSGDVCAVCGGYVLACFGKEET